MRASCRVCCTATKTPGTGRCWIIWRARTTHPFDLWVFIGNPRAARQEGWYAHRYLDDQEDFNRVWGLKQPTTRMRRCADSVLAQITAAAPCAALDLHNNTGDSPPYAVIPSRDPEALHLAALCGDTGLAWLLPANTLMEALAPHCPIIAVECGLAGLAASTRYACTVLDRFLHSELPAPPGTLRAPERVFAMHHRVTVRPEVPFAFGGTLSDEVDLVLTPGLETENFGMLFAGTRLGRVHPGAAMPLRATDMRGQEQTQRFFAVTSGGELIVTSDVTPAMMTTTVVQTRRDCLCYLTRRRS